MSMMLSVGKNAGRGGDAQRSGVEEVVANPPASFEAYPN
jgi:hypothetical protein